MGSVTGEPGSGKGFLGSWPLIQGTEIKVHPDCKSSRDLAQRKGGAEIRTKQAVKGVTGAVGVTVQTKALGYSPEFLFCGLQEGGV